MHSQQAWSVLQHLASPLVHVMQQPSFVFSHLHSVLLKSNLQIWMSFWVQQQEKAPSHAA